MSIIRAAKVAKDAVLLPRHLDVPAIEQPMPLIDMRAEPATIADWMPLTHSYPQAATDEPPPAPEIDPRIAIEQAREDAERRGFEAGFAAGQSAGQQEFDERLKALDTLATGIRHALEEGIAGVEDLQAEIVFEAVCKILGQAMLQEEGAILAVKEVIGRAKDRNVVVRVSQDDYALLSRNLERLQAFSEGHIELLADSRVLLGGCLLETSGGNLDGRLEIQLQQFKDVLLGALQRRIRMDGEIL